MNWCALLLLLLYFSATICGSLVNGSVDDARTKHILLYTNVTRTARWFFHDADVAGKEVGEIDCQLSGFNSDHSCSTSKTQDVQPQTVFCIKTRHICPASATLMLLSWVRRKFQQCTRYPLRRPADRIRFMPWISMRLPTERHTIFGNWLHFSIGQYLIRNLYTFTFIISQTKATFLPVPG